MAIKMKSKKEFARWFVSNVIFITFILAILQLAILFGVEKKSFLAIAWDQVAGGSTGAIAGVAFFIIIGGIGWVSGAIYGSLGLIALVAGGALVGLGLGSLLNIARNPSHYDINWLIFLAILIMGLVLARPISNKATSLYIKHIENRFGGKNA